MRPDGLWSSLVWEHWVAEMKNKSLPAPLTSILVRVRLLTFTWLIMWAGILTANSFVDRPIQFESDVGSLLFFVLISFLTWALSDLLCAGIARLLIPLRHRLAGAAPGGKLASILSTLYSKKKYEAIFRQAIADMREEYFEALAAGKTRKAKWIWFRGVWSIWAAIVMDIPLTATRMAVKIWKASQ